jgi:HSP20 family protein
MNALTRWDPFKDLDDLQTRLSFLFGKSPMTVNGGLKETMKMSQWSPLVDIVEDDKEYLIKAELPEVKKDDVKVMVHDNVLEMTGEREQMKEEKGKKFHRVERSYGSFERSFALPEDADAAKLLAEFKDGVLKVHIPKSEKARPRSVEIKLA